MRSIFDRQPKIERWMAQAAPGIFPDGRFGPLVEAALRPIRAVEAWDAYRTQLSSETADVGETRLYPLIGTNLKACGVEAPDPQLLVASRSAIALSTVLLQAAESVNKIFAREGISVVFTKGLALQITEYRNPVLRTFSDIDCCIHVDDIAAVVQMAREQGWHNSQNLAPQNAHVVEAHAEMTFRLPSGVSLDIHWVPRRAFAFQPALIRQFFDSTEIVEWRGQAWRVPSATWRLIETIEHGIAANEVVPIRWIPDAVRLLENPANKIDWDLIAAAARAARLQLVFLAGLTRLAEISDSVSDAELARFKGPVGSLQAREFRARLRLSATMGNRLRNEVLHYFLRAPGSIFSRITRFPAFLIKGAGRSPRLGNLLARVWHHKNAR